MRGQWTAPPALHRCTTAPLHQAPSARGPLELAAGHFAARSVTPFWGAAQGCVVMFQKAEPGTRKLPVMRLPALRCLDSRE